MPPTPAPAAPAAPAAAPAAPAAPSTPPAAPAAAPATPSLSTEEASIFEKFDTDLRTAEKPAGTPPAAAPAGTPPAGTPPKPATTPPEAPAGIPTFKTPKELREWAHSRHQLATTLETEKTKLETRIKELEARIPQTAQDASALNQKITELQGRVDDYEQRVRLLDYQRSDEYKTTYQQPYQDAVKLAYREVKELLVSEPTGEKDADGHPVMREREANDNDFDEIYSLPLGQATKLAKQKFGDAFSIVLNHRQAIKGLAEKAIAAITNWKGKAEEHAKQEKEREATERTTRDTFWQRANQYIGNDPRNKEYWGRGDDPEANKALDEGFALADKRFSEEYAKMPLQERIVLDAVLRHRIAGFSLQRYQLVKLKEQIAAKDAEIAQLRGSRPGPPTPSGAGTPPAEPDSVLDAFDQKMKE